MIKTLVVEDNIDTQLLLKTALSTRYALDIASDLKSAWDQIEKKSYDIILLDRNLPDGDGLSLCQKLRVEKKNDQTFILMLTGHSDLEDKVSGLNAGADDYLVKPFDFQELIARMETLLRRKETPLTTSNLSLENLVINLETHVVRIFKSSTEIITPNLTPIEFKILLSLVKNYGHEVDRNQLVNLVWDKINLSARNVDTHICHLRKKISDSYLTIKNSRGKGYSIKKTKVLSPQVIPEINQLPFLEGNQNAYTTH